MTSDLLRLDDWLHELGVTVVAMESTGVFSLSLAHEMMADFLLEEP